MRLTRKEHKLKGRIQRKLTAGKKRPPIADLRLLVRLKRKEKT
ncbi:MULTISPECIES: hypothetical protein [unclassified Mesorhizobium]|nr:MULTISPECIES: hypothetical protein [unclassified Mesorhizobium]